MTNTSEDTPVALLLAAFPQDDIGLVDGLKAVFMSEPDFS